MYISAPVLAILIALFSLALSVYTSVSTRRASQLQRLASIRTKMSSLQWKIRFDLDEYDRCAKHLDSLLGEEETTHWQEFSSLTDDMPKIDKLKSDLDLVSETLSKFPLTLPAGRIDEIEHDVDRIIMGIDIANQKLLPRILKLIEHLELASSGKGCELPDPSPNTDATQ